MSKKTKGKINSTVFALEVILCTLKPAVTLLETIIERLEDE